ncbi:MAG: ribosome maturation factor RimP [Pseudomonadota bacterium]
MRVVEQIEQLLDEPLSRLGFDIVRVQIQDSKRQVLEVMIERRDRAPVALDDCVAVSREAAILLDVENSLKSAYVLEVTSPGMDRPLVKPEDFKRFVGSTIKLQTMIPVDDQKRFRGTLKGLEDEKVVIEVEVGKNEGKVVRIPLLEISRANLVPEFG